MKRNRAVQVLSDEAQRCNFSGQACCLPLAMSQFAEFFCCMTWFRSFKLSSFKLSSDKDDFRIIRRHCAVRRTYRIWLQYLCFRSPVRFLLGVVGL